MFASWKRALRQRDAAHALLRESVRDHYHCDDSWFCCPQCTSADHGLAQGEPVGPQERYGGRTVSECDCGAEAWNARVRALIG